MGNKESNAIQKIMRTYKTAASVKPGDTIVRFGHSLKVLSVEPRVHPLGLLTISIRHERATVDYAPSHKVQCAS